MPNGNLRRTEGNVSTARVAARRPDERQNRDGNLHKQSLSNVVSVATSSDRSISAGGPQSVGQTAPTSALDTDNKSGHLQLLHLP